MKMLRGRLFGALSSLLLLLILLAGIPTSEAIKCLRGGTCLYRNFTGELAISRPDNDLKVQECPDACYRFDCAIGGHHFLGYGCEADLRATCPSFTEADIAKLKKDKSVNWVGGDSYGGFACKGDNCKYTLIGLDRILAAIEDPTERAIAEAEASKNVTVEATTPCKYKEIPMDVPSTKTFECLRGGTCSYFSLIEKRAITSKESLEIENCPDACYVFSCVINGQVKKGFGCEDELRAVCPSFTEADIAKLKEDKNVTFVGTDEIHNAFACKAGDCQQTLYRKINALAALDRTEIPYAVGIIAKGLPASSNEPCEYVPFDTLPDSSTAGGIDGGPAMFE